MQVLYDAGFVDLGSTYTDEYTYLFGGVVGSLDHVLASTRRPRARSSVPTSGTSTRSSRWRTSTAATTTTPRTSTTSRPYRSSDHDPLVVGFDAGAGQRRHGQPAGHQRLPRSHRRQHGRSGPARSRSSARAARRRHPVRSRRGRQHRRLAVRLGVQEDQPDHRRAQRPGPGASAVGNHEFDKGYADLTGSRRPTGRTGTTSVRTSTRGHDGIRALDEYRSSTVDGSTSASSAPSPRRRRRWSPRPASTASSSATRSPRSTASPTSSPTATRPTVRPTSSSPSTTRARRGHVDGATLEEELAAGPVFERHRQGDLAEGRRHLHRAHAQGVLVGRAGPRCGRGRDPSGHADRQLRREHRPGHADRGHVDQEGHVVHRRPHPAAHRRSTRQGRQGRRGRAKPVDDQMVAAYGQRVADVRSVVTAALDKANVGGAPNGRPDRPRHHHGVRRAASGTTAASESTLGNIVANMLRDTMADRAPATPRSASSTRAVSVRSCCYADTDRPRPTPTVSSPTREANAVLPFVNNL